MSLKLPLRQVFDGVTASKSKRAGRVFSRLGADRATVDRSEKVVTQGGLVVPKRAGGQAILVSPTYFADSLDRLADLAAAGNSKRGEGRLRRSTCTCLGPDHPTGNGRVSGVLTGVRHATHERVVIADDVRYYEDALRRVISLLNDADVVRPQNFFHPLSWHARMDTAGILLSRVSLKFLRALTKFLQ